MILQAGHYFSRVKRLIGFRGAVIFSFYYVWYASGIVRPKLCKIPVGSFIFYAPSIRQFAGLFMEIVIREYYYLDGTTQSIEAIDCGANIGVSLLYIKLRAPNSKVKCFEPNPAALEILRKNITENGWEEDVVVYPYALAKAKGEADFFIERDEATSFGASLSRGMAGKRPLVSFKVRTERLSDYVSKPVDFLKIDIEGGEFDVLEDLAAAGKLNAISQIQMEYHYHPEFFQRRLSELLVFLEKEGFRIAVKATAEPHALLGSDRAHAYMVYAWRNAW